MTISPKQAHFEEQRDLLSFMAEYKVSATLVSDLLNLECNTVYKYRMGWLKISQDNLKLLKSKYKSYMADKLAKL